MSTLSDMISGPDFYVFFQDLETGGWFHFVFPFLLVYAVIFTILNQVDLFKERKSVKVIIALVIGFFAIGYPITGEGSPAGEGQTLADLMMSLFPGVTAFSMAILALYIIAAMLGVDLTKFLGQDDKDRWIRYILGAVGIFVVVYYYARGFGWEGFGYGGNWFTDLLTDPFFYILIIFGLFFWWVTQDDDDERSARKRLEEIEKGKRAEKG